MPGQRGFEAVCHARTDANGGSVLSFNTRKHRGRFRTPVKILLKVGIRKKWHVEGYACPTPIGLGLILIAYVRTKSKGKIKAQKIRSIPYGSVVVRSIQRRIETARFIKDRTAFCYADLKIQTMILRKKKVTFGTNVKAQGSVCIGQESETIAGILRIFLSGTVLLLCLRLKDIMAQKNPLTSRWSATTKDGVGV